MPQIVVAALYRFVRLADASALRRPLLDRMRCEGVRGTVLLAEEGINGTIAGPRKGIDAVLDYIRSDPRFRDLQLKRSRCDAMPFRRTKVRLKREIVTMGVEGIDPARQAGDYVKPGDWNDIIADPGVTVIDTRNDYEVELGTFRGAVDPQTASFRDFPAFVDTHLDPKTHKKVAMFCTGGVRCEKATAYLKQRGFEQVLHLEGGVLKYLEAVPAERSLWRGECFVFDERVSVGHGLKPGGYALCYACRMPISEADTADARYRKGVSCPRCFDKVDPERRSRFEQRQRQVELASRRGESHIGDDVKR